MSIHTHALWCDANYPGRKDPTVAGYQSRHLCQVERIEVVNDHEIIMHCKVACLDMPFYYSSASNVMIFSKKQWDAEGEMGYERKPAGTGPYIFKERELGRYVLYERAPTPHWKHGVVDWKEIQMTWTLEESTRFAQLLAGETHLTEVNKDLTDELVAKGYKLIRSRGTAQQMQINFGGLYFGTEDPQTKRYTENGGTTGKLDRRSRGRTSRCGRRSTRPLTGRNCSRSCIRAGPRPCTSMASTPTWRAGTPPGRSASRRCTATTQRRRNGSWPRRAIPKASKPKPGCIPSPGRRKSIPLVEAVHSVARGGHRAGAGRGRLGGGRAAKVAVNAKPMDTSTPSPPSKKAVEPQLAVFNTGKGIPHQFETDELYKMWEELLQLSDPKARDAQLRKIGNYKFENFETIPLFNVFIEVIVDPKIVADWPFPGWDGGDIGHTWLIHACKQETPCR